MSTFLDSLLFAVAIVDVTLVVVWPEMVGLAAATLAQSADPAPLSTSLPFLSNRDGRSKSLTPQHINMFSYKKITTRPAAAAAPIDAGRSVPAMSSVHRGTIATVAAKSANPPALGAKKSTFATSWRSIKTAARRVSGRKVTQGVSSSGLGWISAESLGDAGFQLVSVSCLTCVPTHISSLVCWTHSLTSQSRFSPVADAKIPSTSYSAPFDFDKVASMELPVDLTTAQAFADKLWMAIIAVHQELMGFQVPFPAFGIKRDATFDRATLFAMKEHHDVVVRLLARCVAEFENSNMAFFHNMRLSATDKIASSAKTVLEEQEKALAKERLLADVDAWLGLKPEQAAPKVSITRKARITRKKLEQEEREAQEMDEATALQVDNMVRLTLSLAAADSKVHGHSPRRHDTLGGPRPGDQDRFVVAAHCSHQDGAGG